MGNLRHMDLRDLPAVDELARQLADSAVALPEPLISEIARAAIDDARERLQRGDDADPHADARRLVAELTVTRPQRVINATGVLLHTNLGRAPIDGRAMKEGGIFGGGYGNLEIDLASGERGGRGAYGRRLLTTLTGAEMALVVNNNAAALFLALAALAAGQQAVVSRGELIEIGGSFRLPELMAASGAQLFEVGTTNRTRLDDYAAAIDGAALVLKVHPSNYRIEGFAEEVGYRELAALASGAGVPFVADVGSGLLDTRTPWLDGPPPEWLADEPGVRQTLDAGADVVLFSGDKLLGGPQAGIAVGNRSAIERMARHPIARAVRLDGTSQAVLGRTLELYASGQAAEIPFWRMAMTQKGTLEKRHQEMLAASGIAGAVIAGESLPGAGSVPRATIPSPNLELEIAAERGWKTLIAADPPVLARRQAGMLRLDLRTVDPRDDAHVTATLATLR